TMLVLPLITAGPAPAKPPSGDARAAAATAVAWQRIALRTIFTEAATPPAAGGLYLAFASRAVDDAAQHVLRRGGSARAAVATAAHGVLTEYFATTSAANLDADLASELAAVPDGRAEAKGVRIGERAAARLIKSREDDGRNDPSKIYSKPDKVGYWQPPEVDPDDPPPPGGGMAVAWLGFVDPLVSIRRVRLDGPDRLSSLAYAADYQEALKKGSSTPTPELADEALTAQFFAFNPIIMYRQAVCDLLTTSPMGLRNTTRLFATIDTAVATAAIETFRLKFKIGFWRPAEAINDLRDDGNPATEPQPGWQPLVPNPIYSDYTSGHASATAPFATVMRRTFGDDVTLTLTKPNPTPAPPEVRTYTSLSDIEFHALNARIWGGLHFRDAMEDGYYLGHRTARRVMRAMR
ncbi:MAG: vanadium-dependent haloperoxidase, partial [Nocardioides sp.]